MVTKKTPKVVLTAVAIVIAAYILSPFYLVLINTFKNANGIVANPVSFAGASFAQFKTNISNVVNNSNFSFWSAFGTSAIITVVSLVLLALFGGMAAWVICRNKTKWSTAIYMTFIASMTIPFQVVMLFCHKICNLHKFLWRGVRPPPGSDDKAQSRKVRTSDEISAIPYTPKPAGFPYSFCFFL